MDQKLIEKLNKRKEEGTLRSLSHFKEFADFYSNDYLGLSRVPFNSKLNTYGGTGSRLISGNSDEILQAEKEIAGFFKAESGLMFNSGYDANIGFFSCVPQRGDTVLYDEYIHASVRDGIRLGLATNHSFKHNDISDLENKLSKIDGVVYVAVESLYSMDGDIAPLRMIIELCEKYNAHLIVDEAHSAGVYGKQGIGLVASLGMENRVFTRIVTFGKAYGSHGACVLGERNLIDYLTNFARSFIYTTALPVHVYLRNANNVLLSSIDELRNQLQGNLNYFRSSFEHSGLLSVENSPIQILEIGDIKHTKSISDKLLVNKIAVKPIFSPTVPVGKERLRICFHAFNTKEEIDLLISLLS